jgi:hypothetical protein
MKSVDILRISQSFPAVDRLEVYERVRHG